jgi:hypothetical protein
MTPITHRLFLPLFIGSIAIAGRAFAEMPPTVLFPGDPVPFAELVSQNWFALCLDGAPALKKVTVSAKPLADGKKGAVPAGCASPLVMLRGARWLKERTLTPFACDKQEASAKITGGGSETNLWVTAEEPNGPYLNVERESITQFFWTQPKTQWDQWELVWAGDLDGDGAPDFITRAWSEEEADLHNFHAIFLSSLAREGELYGVIGLPFEIPSK